MYVGCAGGKRGSSGTLLPPGALKGWGMGTAELSAKWPFMWPFMYGSGSGCRYCLQVHCCCQFVRITARGRVALCKHSRAVCNVGMNMTSNHVKSLHLDAALALPTSKHQSSACLGAHPYEVGSGAHKQQPEQASQLTSMTFCISFTAWVLECCRCSGDNAQT